MNAKEYFSNMDWSKLDAAQRRTEIARRNADTCMNCEEWHKPTGLCLTTVYVKGEPPSHGMTPRKFEAVQTGQFFSCSQFCRSESKPLISPDELKAALAS